MRFTRVLAACGNRAGWYRREAAADQPPTPLAASRRGPAPAEIPDRQQQVVTTVAKAFPWYGYKKVGLICDRLDEFEPRRCVYRIMKRAGLLHQRRRRIEARARQELARLHQLLPKAPNDLWQMDVTYIPIAGYGWWYAVTVIDYYSRYLLAVRFTHSYSALEVGRALKTAVEQAQRVRGPLTRPVFLVTDNGSSFIAHRFRDTLRELRIAGQGISAFSQVRIGYRMPAQLGLLERFHETLKAEEVYWNLYADPRDARNKMALFQERYNQARPHWALRPADPAAAPARVLTPEEVYVENWKVNPPPWSRWVGWLEQDQESLAQPSHKTELCASA